MARKKAKEKNEITKEEIKVEQVLDLIGRQKFVDKIKKPFSLVLFDHHTDMLQPMIHDLTSCGSWAGHR